MPVLVAELVKGSISLRRKRPSNPILPSWDAGLTFEAKARYEQSSTFSRMGHDPA